MVRKAKNKKLISEEGPEGAEAFEVDSISSHFIHRRTRQTIFKVKYSNYPTAHLQTIDGLLKCPALIEKMERRKGCKEVTKVHFMNSNLFGNITS